MALFDDFWTNHPSTGSRPNRFPCKTNGQPNHPNQCVIRLGVALTRSDVKIKNYNGVFCWSGHGRRHPLRVEEMKHWLNSSNAPFVGQAVVSTAQNGAQKTYQDYLGQRGIVAFRNFWGQNDQGDHIDLWDGQNIAQGSLDYFERSEEIWFWKMP